MANVIRKWVKAKPRSATRSNPASDWLVSVGGGVAKKTSGKGK